MTEIAIFVPAVGTSDLLLIADHASNRIPDGIDLQIPPALLGEHVAADIGIEPLTRALAARLGAPAIVARVSRLVIDFNRDPDEENLIPAISDGHVIAGNARLDALQREARIARFWTPYHGLISDQLDRLQPRMIVSLHSFTPQLATRPEEARPWQVGILYNEDDRAARLAIPMLRAQGIPTGDNQPYSGRDLNATMNRHAESRGLPYLGFEIRQDLIVDAQGVEQWAQRLAPIVTRTCAALA
ncbi:MAG: N-formylglutamate amidohydrolase [Alphaproteobacteria bacterium]|nr:N-formylglutamate amidohydrolase [Alphaproteobacteria bacterium]